MSTLFGTKLIPIIFWGLCASGASSASNLNADEWNRSMVDYKQRQSVHHSTIMDNQLKVATRVHLCVGSSINLSANGALHIVDNYCSRKCSAVIWLISFYGGNPYTIVFYHFSLQCTSVNSFLNCTRLSFRRFLRCFYCFYLVYFIFELHIVSNLATLLGYFDHCLPQWKRLLFLCLLVCI